MNMFFKSLFWANLLVAVIAAISHEWIRALCFATYAYCVPTLAKAWGRLDLRNDWNDLRLAWKNRKNKGQSKGK